jgi:hypothetical protein
MMPRANSGRSSSAQPTRLDDDGSECLEVSTVRTVSLSETAVVEDRAAERDGRQQLRYSQELDEVLVRMSVIHNFLMGVGGGLSKSVT